MKEAAMSNDKNLSGYQSYLQTVRYRLIPFIW
jgi:hypothetical protein